MELPPYQAPNPAFNSATELKAYASEVSFVRLLLQPAPATRVLLYMLVGIFVLDYAVENWVVAERFTLAEDSTPPMILFAAKINGLVHEGQWWRLFTHTFLHGGFLHLIFNAYGLLLLGNLVERLFGTYRFATLYAIAGLAGGCASLFFNTSASVGASGAIYGVFGAAIVFGYKFKDALPKRVSRALTVGLLPWLALSLAFGLLPMIDNAAHFGGLAAGSLVALCYQSPLIRDTPEPSLRWLKTLTALVVLLTVCAWLLSAVFASNCLESQDSWRSCQAIELAP